MRRAWSRSFRSPAGEAAFAQVSITSDLCYGPDASAHVPVSPSELAPLQFARPSLHEVNRTVVNSTVVLGKPEGTLKQNLLRKVRKLIQETKGLLSGKARTGGGAGPYLQDLGGATHLTSTTDLQIPCSTSYAASQVADQHAPSLKADWTRTAMILGERKEEQHQNEGVMISYATGLTSDSAASHQNTFRATERPNGDGDSVSDLAQKDSGGTRIRNEDRQDPEIQHRHIDQFGLQASGVGIEEHAHERNQHRDRILNAFWERQRERDRVLYSFYGGQDSSSSPVKGRNKDRAREKRDGGGKGRNSQVTRAASESGGVGKGTARALNTPRAQVVARREPRVIYRSPSTSKSSVSHTEGRCDGMGRTQKGGSVTGRRGRSSEGTTYLRLGPVPTSPGKGVGVVAECRLKPCAWT